jgi:predicted transcriptional regulator
MEAPNTRRHESAFMTAAHILMCLTKEGKSIENIAKDFDNNLELVSVWIDYMIGINWMYKDGSDNKWIATENGKKWIERYYDIRDD